MIERKAGRELDCEIAERLMGFRWWVVGSVKDPIRHRVLMAVPWSDKWTEWNGAAVNRFTDFDREVPHYSTDIAAAWRVLRKLQADGWHYSIESVDGSEITAVCLFKVGKFTRMEGSTPAHAICLAVLEVAE